MSKLSSATLSALPSASPSTAEAEAPTPLSSALVSTASVTLPVTPSTPTPSTPRRKSPVAPPRETKPAILCRLLSRRAGADLAALQAATGWQAHSVRAGLSGLRKAGYVIGRTDPAKPGGTAVYRITGRPEGLA